MALPVDPVIGELYTIGEYSFEYMGDGVFQRKDITIPDSSKWEADGETSIKPKDAKTVDASHISGLPDGSNWEGDGVGYIKPKDLNLVKRVHLEIAEEEYVPPDASNWEPDGETSIKPRNSKTVDAAHIVNLPDGSRWEDDGATHIKPKDLKLVDRDYLDIDEEPVPTELYVPVVVPEIPELEIPETEVSDIVELVSEDNTGHPVTTDTVLRISINGVEYEINAKTVV